MGQHLSEILRCCTQFLRPSLYDDIRDETQKKSSTASGILYADQGGDVRGRKILMLANRDPIRAVDDQYGEVFSKPIPDDFLEYDTYRYKVIVNPTRRHRTSRKLMAVRGREAVGHWFIERATKNWGFVVEPESLQVDRINVLQFKDKEQRHITIGQAHIQGILRITDKEQFTRSFNQGIGRARAFGCGLLQIVPVVNDPFA